MYDFPGQVLFYICGPTKSINSSPFHFQKYTFLNYTFYKHSNFEEDIQIFIIMEKNLSSEIQSDLLKVRIHSY